MRLGDTVLAFNIGDLRVPERLLHTSEYVLHLPEGLRRERSPWTNSLNDFFKQLVLLVWISCKIIQNHLEVPRCLKTQQSCRY